MISRYCRLGRLRGAARKTSKGRWQIDPAGADQVLAAEIDPARAKPPAKKKRGGAGPGARGGARGQKRKGPPAPEEAEEVIEKAGLQGLDFITARTENEKYKAALNKLKWQTATKHLVRRGEVERAAFNVGRAVRDAVLNVPPRVAAILAGETDQFRVEKILSDELKKALDELSSDKFGAGSSAEHAA